MPSYLFDLDRALALGLLRLAPDEEPSQRPPPASEAALAQLPHTNDALAKAWLRLLDILPYSSEEEVGQREVLQFIKENSGTTVSAMSDHFNLIASSLAGIINGGIQRNIKKAGFPEVKFVLDMVKEGKAWHYYAGVVLQAQPPIQLKRDPRRRPPK